jgi:hypothetical protein
MHCHPYTQLHSRETEASAAAAKHHQEKPGKTFPHALTLGLDNLSMPSTVATTS